MVRIGDLRVVLFAAVAALAFSPGEAAAGFASLSAVPSGSGTASSSSFAAGGHAGYNWQQGSFVFGFETDLQATHLNSVMNGNVAVPSPVAPLSAQTTALINWYGTLRGRLGVASGPWLLYGTAGLAYGHVDLSSTFAYGNVSTSLQQSEVRAGWVGGAGVSYLIYPNVSVDLIYQYLDLGNVSAASTNTARFLGGPNLTLNQSTGAHAQFQTVMAGITWRFAPVPQSGPWAGGTVGANVGGAWGNDANATYSSCCASGGISDVRLKRDIALVARRSDGLGVYSFKYVWSDETFVGVMAQEVALIHPDAVLHDPLTGYLAVDYARLGLPLIMVH